MSVTAPPEITRHPQRYDKPRPPTVPVTLAVPPLDDAQNDDEPPNPMVTELRAGLHPPVGSTSTIEYRAPLAVSALSRNVYKSAMSGVNVGLRIDVDER